MMISKTWRARAEVTAAECGRDRNSSWKKSVSDWEESLVSLLGPVPEEMGVWVSSAPRGAA